MVICHKSEIGLDQTHHLIMCAMPVYVKRRKQASHDQSPQTTKGHKTSDDNSIAVKFSDNISEIWSLMMLFNSEITMILVLVDNHSCLVSADSETW